MHCKAGKGRTGTIIACLLVKLGLCKTSGEALDLFGGLRTSNGKGVTIPSQKRYVHYYGDRLRLGRWPATQKLALVSMRLRTVPNFDTVLEGGGCDPYFHISARTPDGKMIKIYNYLKHYKTQHYKRKHPEVVLELGEFPPPVLQGDIKITLYDHDTYSADDKMCHLWFNTDCVTGNRLSLAKKDIDKACKDKKCQSFAEDFQLELVFEAALTDGPVTCVAL